MQQIGGSHAKRDWFAVVGTFLILFSVAHTSPTQSQVDPYSSCSEFSGGGLYVLRRSRSTRGQF